MVSEKVGLFVLMFVVSGLGGCSHDAQKETAQREQGDTVCSKRADLRLIAGALNRNTASMEAAIKSGADLNVMVEGLGPPIVISALGDNLNAVRLLLDGGANINAEDSEGYTALINASLSNNPDMVRLLLSKGANVNAPSNLMVNGKKAGFTPLMIAKSKGHQEIVQLLMEAGAKK